MTLQMPCRQRMATNGRFNGRFSSTQTRLPLRPSSQASSFPRSRNHYSGHQANPPDCAAIARHREGREHDLACAQAVLHDTKMTYVDLYNRYSSIGRQKSEGRRQKSEGRSQKSEVRSQKSEGRRQKSEVRSQNGDSLCARSSAYQKQWGYLRRRVLVTSPKHNNQHINDASYLIGRFNARVLI